VAKGPVGLRGVIVDVEESTGKALSIRRFSEDVEE
jgi:calcineurin-like phosphoesterase